MKNDNIEVQYDHIISEKNPNGWWIEIDDRELFFANNTCKIDKEEETIIMPEWLCIKLGLEAYII